MKLIDTYNYDKVVKKKIKLTRDYINEKYFVRKKINLIINIILK